ncbi:MAG: 1,4-dihydroxy-2-naphthoate polyprenyltransferase, partial [Deltaproteobacteria bacterium]|nr:1,4-dihydroxy-2-naphthoate polyprenyltransferase [Deltaproteobacteria bacterium]
WLAARPATLSAAFVPVAVGTACAAAAGGVRALPALAALLGAFAIQIGTNFANDLFDFEKGADTEERVGPTRAAQAGLLSVNALRVGMLVSFAFATLLGVYLTWVAGPVVVLVGVLSILSGVAYTGGPYPLGYHGLGDVFVLVFFGLVAVVTTAFVQVGQVSALSLWASWPVGALATAILVVNNVRDRETDVLAGKGTLVVRWGRRAGLAEYALLLVTSYAVPVLIWRLGLAGPLVLLPLLTSPLAALRMRQLVTLRGEALNATLVGTAKLLLVFGLLFSLGLAFSQALA